MLGCNKRPKPVVEAGFLMPPIIRPLAPTFVARKRDSITTGVVAGVNSVVERRMPVVLVRRSEPPLTDQPVASATLHLPVSTVVPSKPSKNKNVLAPLLSEVSDASPYSRWYVALEPAGIDGISAQMRALRAA